MTDKECDRDAAQFLQDITCQNCGKDIDPKYADWHMCTACGDQVTSDMATWEVERMQAIADQAEFDAYWAMRAAQEPQPTKWEKFCFKYGDREWHKGDTLLAYTFTHAGDFLVHFLFGPYFTLSLGHFAIAFGNPVEWEPDGQTW